MTNATKTDTRTRYGSNGRIQSFVGISTSSSQIGSTNLALFQRAVHELTRTAHLGRLSRIEDVVRRLRKANDPFRYIGELIDHCATRGGPEGLDIAIDVLSHCGELAVQYAREFWKTDYPRWLKSAVVTGHHFNDDAWYILLRAAALSGLETWQKVAMLLYCAMDGTESIREASVRALGDVGGVQAIRLLRRLESGETSGSVRQAIAEVLDDLED